MIRFTVSLNHLIRSHQHIRRNRQTDLLGGLRLNANSNFVGCSTGMSNAFLPFRILSTMPAARRSMSVLRFGESNCNNQGKLRVARGVCAIHGHSLFTAMGMPQKEGYENQFFGYA